jgi:hypothetical protein
MIRLRSVSVLIVLAMELSLAWGQDASNPQLPQGTQGQPSSASSSGNQPPGNQVPDNQSSDNQSPDNQDNQVPSISENPPISGLDLPNLEPHAAPLSYLQAGAHVSESADSNIQNNLGGSSLQSVSRAQGSLELERLWSHYDLALDYLGGVSYYNVQGIGLRQIEELGFHQKITWKRGEFGVHDAFSYQPEGTFGSAYGAVGATGAGLSDVGSFFGGSALGSLGQVPRIMNLALVDVVESLTPKSTLTGSVGYGFLHFLQNDPDTGGAFIGSSQVSGELGYSRILGPHDQGAIIYGYQNFQFSTGVTFHSNLVQLAWGHRISGRMDLLVSAGPQFTKFDHFLEPVTNPTSADTIPPCVIEANFTFDCPSNDFRISAAGRILLRYRLSKVNLSATYEHYLTSGSGFFAGAETDNVHVGATRQLSRVWDGFVDLGYSRNSRVTQETCSLNSQNCPGVLANTYQYGFAGVGVHRMFGRNFHAFASYQFNELAFDNSYCGTGGECGRISQRHIGTIGLDWTPRPIRLD